MFEPSEKVVCVDDKFPNDIRDYMNALPVKDRVYTVRDIVGGIGWDNKPTIAVLLVELHNLPNEHGIEPGFAPHRFALQEEVTLELHTYETVSI
jgi:hypothetical protein